jgi:hypothetical protein
MRVALITTGRMELLALPGALKAMFPAHEFVAEPHRPGEPFSGFTCKPVRALSPSDPPGRAVELIRAALGTIKPADFRVISR